jgi:signal transduction histidine kinase
MTRDGLRPHAHGRLVRRSRWRVAVPASLVVAALLVILAGGAYLLTERSVYQRLESRLERLAGQARDVGEPGGYLLFDERGHLLSAAPLPVDEQGDAFHILSDPRLGQLATLRMPFTSNGPHVVAIVAQNEMQGLEDVRRTLISVTLAATVVALFAGYVLVGLALRPLDDAVRERSEFVALASHQLRTPLAIIRTSAELARDTRGVTPLEAIGTILKQTQRMEALAARLTELARAEASPRSAEVSTDLAGAAAGVVASMQLLAERAGVVVTTDLPPALSIRAEPAEVTEVLSAVIDNAVKFSPRGGTITIRARLERGRAVIEVIDQGPGIAAADLPFVAEPFFRGRHPGGGHGLGLAIARAIVERRGGQVSVASAPGAGTTVRLALPVQRRPALTILSRLARVLRPGISNMRL